MKTKTLIIAGVAAGAAAGAYYIAKKKGLLPTNKQIKEGIVKAKAKVNKVAKRVADNPL